MVVVIQLIIFKKHLLKAISVIFSIFLFKELFFKEQFVDHHLKILKIKLLVT
jgi:hypothetical protein